MLEEFMISIEILLYDVIIYSAGIPLYASEHHAVLYET